MMMDEFEKMGVDLAPEQKARLMATIESLNMSIRQLCEVLQGWRAANQLTDMYLSAFGLKLKDTVVRDLPKTGSKGHWRDVIPRGKR